MKKSTLELITKDLTNLLKINSYRETFKILFKNYFVVSLKNSWEQENYEWSKEVQEAFTFAVFVFSVESLTWAEILTQANKENNLQNN